MDLWTAGGPTFKGHFVHTKPHFGFTDGDAELMVRLFGGASVILLPALLCRGALKMNRQSRVRVRFCRYRRKGDQAGPRRSAQPSCPC